MGKENSYTKYPMEKKKHFVIIQQTLVDKIVVMGDLMHKIV